jgi:PAS domain S-box-containing protein
MLSSLEDPEGILITVAIRDISKRRRAENSLRESEERLRLIVSSAKDYAILMLGPEGHVVSWNEGSERLKGYRAEEILGRHFSCFYLPEDASSGRPTLDLEEAIRNGRSEVEGWRVRKDGSRFFASVVISTLYDESGRLRGFGKITRDISEHGIAQEHLLETMKELTRSNDELQQFVYIASHDLKEPLRMVAIFTQFLADRYVGRLDSDADEFIAFALDGCNRMNRLIEDLLTYSQTNAGKKALDSISCEIPLNEALANLLFRIEGSGAVVTCDALPVLRIDRSQLVTVFQNLIGNAIKYHGTEPPRIHVSAAKSAGVWTFSVRDNGLGIDPRHFERIFVLFQRLHARGEFEGTGMGLAICKKIIDRVGGRIWVESQPEKGSTFHFSLPESAYIQ